MYEFVTDAEIKPYRSYCTRILTELRELLVEEFEIKTEFYLVGSGAKNLVTRDGAGPFDLDYNLRILEMPNRYWNDLKLLKDTVRNSLNRIVKATLFSDGQDSKSVITSNLVLRDAPQKEFSFDIAILARLQNGNLCRLIHNKQNGLFSWCEVPSSKGLGDKVSELKQHGWWADVRETYLHKKNMYLRRGDYNHPSFVVYVETINEVYQKASR